MKVFVETKKLNYQRGTMLKQTQAPLSTLSLLLGTVLSLGAFAKNPIQEAGVGTRGTSSDKSKKNFFSFYHLSQEELPESTSDIALNNGYLIKLAFEFYLNHADSPQDFFEKNPYSQNVRKWIFENQESLEYAVMNSNWFLHEYKIEFDKRKKNQSKISFETVNGSSYIITNIQNPDESDMDIKINIIRALSYILKNQDTSFSFEEIEKELQLKILAPEVKFF